jgi:hypothetical protein
MEAVRTSETSVYNHFTRQYNSEDSSEHHTRRRENLKSHIQICDWNDSSSAAHAVFPTANNQYFCAEPLHCITKETCDT